MSANKRRDPVAIQAYIFDTEFSGKRKVDAYLEHINSEVTPVSASALATSLEKTNIYRDVREKIADPVLARQNNMMDTMKAKYYESFHKLMSEGDMFIETAETRKEKLEAFEEQRKNLRVPSIFTGPTEGTSSPHQNYDSEGIII